MFLAYEDTSNVYERRTVARLWVLVVAKSPDEPGHEERRQLAQDALERATDAVDAQTDPCVAGVVQALQRAKSTKNTLEQRYLDVTASAGEQSRDARLIDDQVHLLRDEIQLLDRIAEPCRTQRMFQ